VQRVEQADRAVGALCEPAPAGQHPQEPLDVTARPFRLPLPPGRSPPEPVPFVRLTVSARRCHNSHG
jgi:hypothetical protein